MADISKYDALIEAAAKKHGVDPDELRAIMHQEDPKGDPKAVGYDQHGHGLMQLDDRYHDVSKADDPAWNIDEGARIYKEGRTAMAKAGVPAEQLRPAAFAAYNHGPDTVLKNIANKQPLDLNSKGENNHYSELVQGHLAKLQPTAASATAPHAEAETDDAPSVEMLSTGEVPFKDYAGRLTAVPKEQASDAYYNKHLTPVSADEYVAKQTEDLLREKYGSGAYNAAKAAGEGALNGLAGDAGDAFLAKTGLEPAEAIKAHERYFGGVRKVAAGAALVGSMLTGEGEAQAPMRAAEAAEAAKALEAAKAVKALGEGAETTTAGELAAGHPAFKGLPAPEAEVAPKQLKGRDVRFRAGEEGPAQDLSDPNQTPLSQNDIDNFTGKFPQKTQPKTPQSAGGTAPEIQQVRDLIKSRGIENTSVSYVQRKLNIGYERAEATLKAAQEQSAGGTALQTVSDADIVSSEAAPQAVDDADIVESAPATKAKPPPAPVERPAALTHPQTGPGFKEAYDATVKQYGKEVADHIVGASPEDSAALDQASLAEEKTNAKGGRSTYNPNGELATGPELNGPGAGEGNLPNQVANHPAFKFAERPAGIKEPLPPERAAGIPEAPGPREPSAFTADAQGNVRDQRVGGAGPALEGEVLPPEANPNAGPNQMGQPGFVADAEGNVRQPAAQQTVDAMATPAAVPPGAPPAPMPPAPVGPPPPTYGELLGKAANFVSTPNKAIFGIGKQFGRALESATGSKLLGHFGQGALETVPFTVGGNLSDATLNDEKITPERLFAGGLGNALLGGSVGAGFGLAAQGLHKLNLKFADVAGRIPTVERVRNMKASFDNVLAGTKQFSKAVYDDGLKYARTSQLLGDSVKAVSGNGSAGWRELNDTTGQFVDALEGNKSPVAQKVVAAHDEYFVAKARAQNDAQLFQAADTFKRKLGDLYHEELRINPGNKEFASHLNTLKRAWIKGVEDTETFGAAGELQAKLNQSWKDLIQKSTRKSPIFSAFMRKGLIDGEAEMTFDEAKIHRFISESSSANPEHGATAKLKSDIMQEWLGAHRDYIGTLRKEIYEPLQRDAEISSYHSAVGGEDGQIAKTFADMKDLTDTQKKSLWQRLLSGHAMRYGAAGAMLMAGVPHAFLVAWTTSMAVEHIMGVGLGKSGFAEALAAHGAKFDGALASAMNDAFAGKAAAFGGSAVGLLRQTQLTPMALTSKDRHEQAAEVAEHLAATVADPSMPGRIAAGTKMLSVAHPELATAVQAQAMTALNYLHDKAPKDPLPPSPFNTVPYRPGHGEVSRFENIAEVVVNPLAVVRDFGNGSLTTEQVQTAQTIYPQIMSRIRQLASDGLAEHAKTMTYQQKLAFGRLMGTPTDWSTQPDSVVALQKTFALPAVGKGNPSAGGAANKPHPPKSAKQATMLSDSVQTNMQSALSSV